MLFKTPAGVERFGFYHPLKTGSGVRIRSGRSGEYFFAADDGRPMFSKNYTAADVTRGRIPRDLAGRAVWQFHGYRHEH